MQSCEMSSFVEQKIVKFNDLKKYYLVKQGNNDLSEKQFKKRNLSNDESQSQNVHCAANLFIRPPQNLQREKLDPFF